jgi:methylmalonyl-CoA mutase
MSALPDQLQHLFPTATQEDWQKRVEIVLKGADFEKKLVSRTYDQIAIQPLYARKADASQVSGATSGSPWRVMARVDHFDADDAAQLALEDLEGGADALCLVPAGAQSARGFGMSFGSVAALDQALAGVRIELIQLRLEPAENAIANALMLASLVDQRKLAPEQMNIDFGIDLIGALAHHGHANWDETALPKQLLEAVSFLLKRGFKGPFLTVDSRPFHEVGVSEAQELGYALGSYVSYLRALESHGIPLDKAAQAISFIAPLDADQFLGIAKLRALRKLIQNVQIVCGLKPEPMMIHAETSWRMLSKRDPHVNILRATIATFAGGIAGADSVTVLPFTSVLGLPDAAARRLARNTSIVLMEESNLWRVIDPASGAGGYEALTDALCAKAWSIFQAVEARGGILKNLIAGTFQQEIAATAKARARATATRKEPITGTSEFANLSEVAPAVLAVQPHVSKTVNSHAKITIQALPVHRSSEAFEALRDRADAVLKATSKRPSVTLVTIGALVDHSSRLSFTKNAFEAGGFAVEVRPSSDAIAPPSPAGGRRKKAGATLLPSTGEGAERSEADEGKLNLICVVGSDAAYAADGIGLVQTLKSKGHTIWFAGRGGELEADLNSAGITRYLFAGCDMVDLLTEALNVSNS